MTHGASNAKLPADDEIVSLFFRRDERAIDECERKYGRLFLSISAGITGDPEDARECVNDAYLKLWNSIPPERPKSFRAYGAAIVRNVSINRYEYNTASRRCGILSELDESIPDTSDDGDGADIAAAIDSFLRTLDGESRAAFVLRYWYCESLSAVASRLCCSEQSVKSRLFRIRKKLRSYLEKEGVSL